MGSSRLNGGITLAGWPLILAGSECPFEWLPSRAGREKNGYPGRPLDFGLRPTSRPNGCYFLLDCQTEGNSKLIKDRSSFVKIRIIF